MTATNFAFLIPAAAWPRRVRHFGTEAEIALSGSTALLLRCCLFCCLALAEGPAAGAETLLSSQANISLLTVMPGDELYAVFGHSALAVQDPARNIDRVYNFGTFDFDQPGFYTKFVRRELDYMLSVSTKAGMVNHYRRVGRPVIEQVLNLSAEEKEKLYLLLEENYLPENRSYRYDFFFDNCSTRLRDVLERTLGSRLSFDPSVAPAKSFREILDQHVIERPFIDMGFDVTLGLTTDRMMTHREIMFLPIYLMEGFDHASMVTAGDTIPLVLHKERLFWYAQEPSAPADRDLHVWIAWLLAALLTFVSIRQIRMGPPEGERRRILDAILFAFIGLLGALVFFLWFATEHSVAHHNLNILWTWPSHLLASIVLLRKKRSLFWSRYFLCCAVTMLLLLAALPLLPQNFHAASVAVILILAARSVWLAYALRPVERELRFA